MTTTQAKLFHLPDDNQLIPKEKKVTRTKNKTAITGKSIWSNEMLANTIPNIY